MGKNDKMPIFDGHLVGEKLIRARFETKHPLKSVVCNEDNEGKKVISLDRFWGGKIWVLTPFLVLWT